MTFQTVDLLDKKANEAWHNYIKMFVHYKNALGDIAYN